MYTQNGHFGVNGAHNFLFTGTPTPNYVNDRSTVFGMRRSSSPLIDSELGQYLPNQGHSHKRPISGVEGANEATPRVRAPPSRFDDIGVPAPVVDGIVAEFRLNEESTFKLHALREAGEKINSSQLMIQLLTMTQVLQVNERATKIEAVLSTMSGDLEQMKVTQRKAWEPSRDQTNAFLSAAKEVLGSGHRVTGFDSLHLDVEARVRERQGFLGLNDAVTDNTKWNRIVKAIKTAVNSAKETGKRCVTASLDGKASSLPTMACDWSKKMLATEPTSIPENLLRKCALLRYIYLNYREEMLRGSKQSKSKKTSEENGADSSSTGFWKSLDRKVGELALPYGGPYTAAFGNYLDQLIEEDYARFGRQQSAGVILRNTISPPQAQVVNETAMFVPSANNVAGSSAMNLSSLVNGVLASRT